MEMTMECEKIIDVKYPVAEIFNSLQGEGAMVGMPVTFVRFAGCNLNCDWCDAKEVWQQKGKMMTVDEIASLCESDTVVFTGGEPCLQPLEYLIQHLHMQGKFLCMETNGTLPTPDGIDWVVCSPKPQKDYYIDGKCFFNELKYIVDENFDVDCIPAEQKQTCGSVWVHPCEINGIDSEETKASLKRCINLVMNHRYLRLGLQIHKIIGVE